MSSIITVADLGTYTGDTLDAGRAALVVDAVNDYIETVTGRSFGEIQSGTESHDYLPVIFLRHADVVTVTDVEYGSGSGTRTTLSPDDYFFNEVGRLVLNQGRNFHFDVHRDYLHVTYTYGSVSVPSDLKLAALSLASDYYTFAANGDSEISSEGVGSYRLQYAKGTNSATGTSHLGAIARYRTARL
jgi:hypothetical protein